MEDGPNSENKVGIISFVFGVRRYLITKAKKAFCSW